MDYVSFLVLNVLIGVHTYTCACTHSPKWPHVFMKISDPSLPVVLQIPPLWKMYKSNEIPGWGFNL